MVFTWKKAIAVEHRKRANQNLQKRTLEFSEDCILPDHAADGTVIADDNEIPDYIWRKPTSEKLGHITGTAEQLAAVDRRGRGWRISRGFDWLQRKTRCLGAIFRIGMKHNNSHATQGRSTEHDVQTNFTLEEDEHTRAKKLTNPGDYRQQASSESDHLEAEKGYSFSNHSTGVAPIGNDVPKLHSPEQQTPQTSLKSVGKEQKLDQGLLPTQCAQPSTRPELGKTETVPMVGMTPIDTASPQEPHSIGSSPSGGQPSEGRTFKRTLHMVVHLLNGGHAMRVGCLDTMSDLNLISHQVVESLGLEKAEYTGHALKSLVGRYQPRWQVTFDWHVAGFLKTYPSMTFVVVDDEYSGDFDVIIGHIAIGSCGFYIVDNKVFLSSADDNKYCPVI